MDRRTFLTLAGALPAASLTAGQTPQRADARPDVGPTAGQTPVRRTEVSIRGDGFLINGQPTYAGRTFQGKKIEGLLMNARVVQGVFDDANPETRGRWVYPDTGRWDPDRNTNEFVAAMAEWRRHGLLGFTVNLQGGTPGGRGGQRGAGAAAGTAAAGAGATGAAAPPTANQPGGAAGAPQPQPAAGAPGPGPQRGGPGGAGRGPAGPTLENTGIEPDGGLRPAYMDRLARILDRADDLGMVAIVGYFYFGQDMRVKDEAAVRQAVLNVTNWILDRGYRNVLAEVNNECNKGYHHEILRPARVPELINLVKSTTRSGRRLLAATSWPGPTANGPREHPDTPAASNVIAASDFVLIHGNGPDDLDMLTRMIHATRGLPGYRTMPVLINEDPNFHFERPTNQILTSVGEYVSWGYYDQGQNNYQDGFQSPPVNWTLSSDNKRQFFAKVKEITGF
jgi:hypothetical protein